MWLSHVKVDIGWDPIAGRSAFCVWVVGIRVMVVIGFGGRMDIRYCTGVEDPALFRGDSVGLIDKRVEK